MTIRLICLDADDTLWHNMRHFNATEEALVAMLQPFADADIARDTLNACEGRNLKLYGYGAKGFTLSMIETAAELAGDQISKSMIEDILAAGRALLAHPVDLFDDVADTLDALAHRGRLVLVTKGDLLHQESKLAASGLGDLFSGIEIVSDKTENTFRRVFGQYGAAPHEAIMAGDSLRSDIRPALEAGAWAAYIPQEGAWVHEIADTPADHPRFRQIDRLAELPALIDTIG
ncbi:MULTISPECIES: HAD family hydrolase [unclassified Sphingobium]|uniref:HAD family hydrolase n=1 Tax=unclassified Sphingobium TaxID=2611147 RepID=UPI000D154BBD|nr:MULTISPECIES: HAD family hydrolase [unclassified Sphingobium]MBG6120669.1 putative hydrolase of the HAD superfamily [Sphingobium sp. JAI105]PSO11992.1 HAD family hydrolase [Sphingobium sp. AEW4]TWD06638.1 putative hydrolase of the HAD superfamily [Sphingobium sp. AEW010]TWD23571.1 putative hydrolase of the HAD superfamily [Sphingobium sp. AEW013]TWD26090.1 putative hydrolase of the HAD superfamily [Sphingobium sp. AEW001]